MHISQCFTALALAWALVAESEGLVLKDDAKKLYHVALRANVTVEPAILLVVASSFGRLIYPGYAPARSPEEVLGPWSPPSEVAENILLGMTTDLQVNVHNNKLGAANIFRGGVAVIDDVFTVATVESLRRLCDESTTFFDQKAGYYGAYLGDGFVSGLLLQASAMIRRRLPRSIGRETLSQIWAYKYDSSIAQGIRVHVDQGRYSVNCWLTPEDSNTDLADEAGVDLDGSTAATSSRRGGNGGLRIFRGDSIEGDALEGITGDLRRANQDFRGLEAAISEARLRAVQQGKDFGNTTDRSGVESIDIGYRQNRCVVFRSNLLHETSPSVRFKQGYRNRRINLTFMFGNSARGISASPQEAA